MIFGWSLIDALYMTAITLTTVGYREVEPVDIGRRQVVYDLGARHRARRVFTGIGVFANMIGNGELSRCSATEGVRRQVAGLSDHYIVCAYGRVGRAVVEELRRQDVSGDGGRHRRRA